MNKQLKGSVMLLLAAIIWGFAFSAQEVVAQKNVGVFSCGASRSLIASLALTLAVLAFDRIEKNGRFLLSRSRRPLSKRELVGGVACGTALAVASALQQAGIGTSGAGKASFITAMYVVLVPVAGAVLFRRRASAHLYLAVLLSLVGLGLITLTGDLTLSAGDALLLLCAVCFCAQVLLVDHFLPGSDGIRLSLVQFITCTVLNGLFALLFEEAPFAGVWDAAPSLLYLGLLSSGCAYTLQILGQRHCPATPAAILMSTESLFGVMGAALFLGERLSLREYLGCAVLFLAVILSELPLSRPAERGTEKGKGAEEP